MSRFQNTRQPDWDWWGRLWPTPGATLRELSVVAGDSLLEIGAGNGYFALPAARITDPAPVYALDIDRQLLAELALLADQQEIDNVVPLVGDARDLESLLDTTVDTVLLANTFHGVDDRAELLSGIYETLRPGGRFVVINWHARPAEETTIAGRERGPPQELRMTPEKTSSAVGETTDFNEPRRVELPPYHYALIFDR